MSLGVNCLMHMYNDYRAATGGAEVARGGGRRPRRGWQGGAGAGACVIRCTVMAFAVFLSFYLFVCLCMRASVHGRVYVLNFEVCAQAWVSPRVDCCWEVRVALHIEISS